MLFGRPTASAKDCSINKVIDRVNGLVLLSLNVSIQQDMRLTMGAPLSLKQCLDNRVCISEMKELKGVGKTNNLVRFTRNWHKHMAE